MSASPPPPPPPPPGGWPPPPGGWAPPPGWGAPQWGPHPGYGQPPVYGWQPQPMLPGSGRFRAQGVGQLLDAAFTLYRRTLGMILAITAVVQVPLAGMARIIRRLRRY